MYQKAFPVIDPVATGANIVRLRKERGMTVRDLQDWFGFEEPRAIYKWQHGETLPSVDNLYALSALLEVPIEDILVGSRQVNTLIRIERQDDSCRPLFYARLPEKQRHSEYVSAICGQASGASEGKPPSAAFGTPGIFHREGFQDLLGGFQGLPLLCFCAKRREKGEKRICGDGKLVRSCV